MDAEGLVLMIRESGGRVHRYRQGVVYAITSNQELAVKLGEMGGAVREYRRIEDDPESTNWDINLLAVKLEDVEPQFAALALHKAAAPVITS